MPKAGFYSVKVGRGGSAVYDAISQYQEYFDAVHKYPGVKHKKFPSRTEAEQWAMIPSTQQGHRPPRQNLFASPPRASSTRTYMPLTTENIQSFAPSPSSLPAAGPPEFISLIDDTESEDELPKKVPEIISLIDDSESEDDVSDQVYVTPECVCDQPPIKTLSEEQQHVMDIVLKGESVFFTGSAGTGKSFLLQSVINRLPPHGTSTAVTASTGIAAVNIGGSTLHSWAGIGLGKEHADILIAKLSKASKKRWRETVTLIIDEISMVDGTLLDKLDYIGRNVRGNYQPFGGIQLVVCGDFFQLPPVPEELDNSRIPITFAFEARCWKEAIPNCYTLNYVFRQKEQLFVNVLNEARTGRLSPAAIKVFQSLNRPLAFGDNIEPTQLFPRRDQVNSANTRRLNMLRDKPRTFVAKDFPGYDGRGEPISQAEATKKLDRNVLAPAMIILKVGAQVMLIKNLEQGHLVNGSLGKIIAFQTPGEARLSGHDVARVEEPEDAAKRRRRQQESLSHGRVDPNETAGIQWPLVEFRNGRILLIEPAEFSVVNVRGRTEAQRDQVPLILAWALSIHKSQGQTLERVKIDLSTTFEKGQAYVALSRATSLEGLEVRGFTPSTVMAHPRVVEWARSLTAFGQPAVVEEVADVMDEEEVSYWGEDDDDELFMSYHGP